MRFGRKKPPQRRYAEYTPGGEVPPPPAPDGRATVRLTISVDIHGWAQANGKTPEEAQTELRERIDNATTALLDKLATDIGDMEPLSATVATS